MSLLIHQPPERPPPHRFTRAEYYQMADLGFFGGHRVELIEGEIVEMAAMKDLHAVAVGIVAQTLALAFPGCWVRGQLPLSLIGDSDPEPDLAVVPGVPRDYKGRGHPASALLVVEIADSSLSFDRSEKASLYARAGIQDYWIVNLVENQVEVLRAPEAQAAAMYGYGYRTVEICRPGESITPLAKPEAVIPVTELLP